MEDNQPNQNITEEPKKELRWSIDQFQSKRNLIILVVAILAVAAIMIVIASKYIEPPSFAPVVEGCRPGDKFSQTTGEPCSGELPPPCQEGEVYDRDTGKLCQ